ncbi:MAG: aquaporin family protein, partial [Gemmatimonadaceae bacterium]
MSPFLGELLGSAILLIVGDGVVANVVLSRTKGNASG